MTNAARSLVTEAEFLALPESMQQVELLDGEVVMAPIPSFRHQEILRRLVLALGRWVDTHPEPVTLTQAPLDIRFGPGRILQPDACVFLCKLPPDQEGPIDRVPDLCIEVLSLNRSYDRVAKRYVYAEAGVREYWLIDQAGAIEVRAAEGLAQVRELVEGKLESPLLPGFTLELKDLFVR
ncbi:MAG: Uma2 family endonuclease [Polyangiaceae bacterium]|nr:Uma2 family endonuclease [Polyangiaceae bacterium]